MAQLNLGELFVRVSADVKDFQKGTNEITNKLKGLGSSIQSAGKSLTTFATLPLVAAGIGMVKVAGDAEEMQSKFNVVFKDIASDAEDWSKSFQDSVGGSRLEIKGMLADSQDMLVGFGATTDEAFEVSKQIQTLGTDLASFQNLQGGATEGVDRLRKGLLGETENLKALGIVINENVLNQRLASEGDNRRFQELTELEKIQLRFRIAQEQSTNAIGDAERTSGSFTNSLRDLRGQIVDLGAQFGEVLIPLLTPMIQRIIELTKRFQGLDDRTRKIILIVAGVIAIIGPLIAIIGTLLVFVSSMITAFTVVAPVIAAISLPVLAIIAVIIALIAIGFKLIRNWDQIKANAIGIFNTVKNVISNAINFVRQTISRGIQGSLRVILGFASRFLQAGRNLVTSIASGIRGAIGKVTSAISNVGQKIRNFLPFSDAKEGPLSDLSKLDFGSPITASIQADTKEIDQALNRTLSLPNVGGGMSNNLGGSPVIFNIETINGRDGREIFNQLRELMRTDGPLPLRIRNI